MFDLNPALDSTRTGSASEVEILNLMSRKDGYPQQDVLKLQSSPNQTLSPAGLMSNFCLTFSLILGLAFPILGQSTSTLIVQCSSAYHLTEVDLTGPHEVDDSHLRLQSEDLS